MFALTNNLGTLIFCIHAKILQQILSLLLDETIET